MFNALQHLRDVRNQKGFSLIEMLVAMAIFVLFTGLIITSYIGIVKSLRTAEEYRVMYSEARHSFEVITEVARNSRYYDETDFSNRRSGFSAAGMQNFSFYSEDRMSKTTFRYVEEALSDDALDGEVLVSESHGKIVVEEGVRDDILDDQFVLEEAYDLHSDQVFVKDLKFYVLPVVDPYLADKFTSGSFYHPKVTVVVIFAKQNARGADFEIKLQTSISSRVYN